MFAPTFREGSDNGKRFVYSQKWSLDFERLIRALEEKFNGEWFICLRVHPQLANSFINTSEFGNHIIDESQADDMYEILAAMDAYITDYSIAVFEAGFAKIPSFIYADDIDKYARDRGQLMWNISTDSKEHVTNNKKVLPNIDVVFPFEISMDNDELENTIRNFDRDKYELDIDIFCKAIDLVFDGNASERLADRIENAINEKNKKD